MLRAMQERGGGGRRWHQRMRDDKHADEMRAAYWEMAHRVAMHPDAMTGMYRDGKRTV